jgi:hypothetical protein
MKDGKETADTHEIAVRKQHYSRDTLWGRGFVVTACCEGG